MKRTFLLITILTVLLLPLNTISAQTITEQPTPSPSDDLLLCLEENEDAQLLRGELTYVGIEPYSDLVLVTGENRDGEVYLVTGELLEELEGYYAEVVQVCGIVSQSNSLLDNEVEVVEYVPLSTVPTLMPTPTEQPRRDLTRETEETTGPLERTLNEQTNIGSSLLNPLKYAIRNSVDAGVPPNTLVLLLLLPGVAALIAASRHIVGLRGFGIFIPAALSVVFIATGPLVGIGLFLVIVFMSTLARMILRKTKIKLQYLPRMALLLWSVVIGILLVLFIAPVLRQPSLTNVSIFPVLILVLLAEDFTRVQLGKSAKTAVNITSETLILALVSYFVLTMQMVQNFALLHPELWILSIAVFDFLVGRYVGLRVMELWRFRKLIEK